MMKVERKIYDKEKLSAADNFILHILKANPPIYYFSTREMRGENKTLLNEFQGMPSLKKYFKNPKRICEFIINNYVGGWDKFLADNGINPDEVRLSGLAEYWKLTPEMKKIRRRNVSRINKMQAGGPAIKRNNDGSKENEVIDSSPTPDVALELEEVKGGIDSAVEGLRKGELAFFNIVMDYLSDPIVNFSDLMTNDFNNFYKDKSGKELGAEDLNKLFEKLKESEGLSSLLLD